MDLENCKSTYSHEVNYIHLKQTIVPNLELKFDHFKRK